MTKTTKMTPIMFRAVECNCEQALEFKQELLSLCFDIIRGVTHPVKARQIQKELSPIPTDVEQHLGEVVQTLCTTFLIGNDDHEALPVVMEDAVRYLWEAVCESGEA